MKRELALGLLLTIGCTANNEGDAKDDSFGGSDVKADGGFSSCQLAEVLKLVNESTSSTDKLVELGLSDDAAKAIVAHRAGPDGDAGTGDDDVFDDLNELDKVDFVGALALGKLVYSVSPRCENDLATRPFMDDQTFTGASGGWPRDSDEVEVVLGVKGLTGQRLRSLLLTKNSDGKTLYDKLRRDHLMEAFTYGYALDEMPWDSDSQAAREQMPLVGLTIESGRYEPNEEGVRELSLGTDLMDDTYFDTHAFSLLGNGIELRGRARWDDPTTVRRLLIAAKFGTEIDADGNKVNAKTDIRNDNGTAFVATLDDDVRRGKVGWSGSDVAVTPIRGVYEQLRDKHLLLDIGAHKGVLLLEATAHLRSTRSRYHMNEASVASLRTVYANARTQIQVALDQITAARTAGIIPASAAAQVTALETLGRGILDRSELVRRIDSTLGVTVTNLVEPNALTTPADAATLAKNRAVAEAINAALDDLAAALDDADRIITASTDEDFDVYADLFRAWRVSVDSTFAKKTTWDSFLNSYASLSTTANRPGSLAAFNTFIGSQAGALDDAGWTRLGGYLKKMRLTVSEHMIETAGLVGQMLWFDTARAFWVPGSSRALSNFMIDTFDMTDMLSNEEWSTVPEADRTFTQPLPAAKVFNTTLVDELQIELGLEKAYVDRMHDLEAKVAAAPTDMTLKAQLEGARFVWQQYTGAMKVLTSLKGDNVLSKLKKAGASSSIKWEAPSDSKGNIALKILSDRD
ncbi:MAG: hypothetical protein ABI678_09520 [Kofleriaceae bacterium]